MVLNCKDLVSTSVIAKDFGKSAVWLNSYLHDKGVQYKQGKINVNNAINKLEEEKQKEDKNAVIYWVDYSVAITPVILNSVCTLLGLTSKEDKKKMENLSYSYIQDFFVKTCKEFTGIEPNTVQSMQKDMERARELQAGASNDNNAELVDPK